MSNGLVYTLSHPENDCDVTERDQGHTLQDASFMRQSQCSFLNMWRNTQVVHAVTSVFLLNTRWRHGRSLGETKYSNIFSMIFFSSSSFSYFSSPMARSVDETWCRDIFHRPNGNCQEKSETAYTGWYFLGFSSSSKYSGSGNFGYRIMSMVNKNVCIKGTKKSVRFWS